MGIEKHVATTLDADYDTLSKARELCIGSEYNNTRVVHDTDADRYIIRYNGQDLASDFSLQDALTMACLFYVGRCDIYDRTPKIVPLRGVREILDELDVALAKRDNVAQDLWHVLTALRGPDFGDEDLKDKSTSAIRSLAFPLTYDACRYGTDSGGNANGAHYMPPSTLDETRIANERTVPLCEPSELSYKTRDHFANHARKAVEALRKCGSLSVLDSNDDDI